MKKFLAISLAILGTGAGCSSIMTSDTVVTPITSTSSTVPVDQVQVEPTTTTPVAEQKMATTDMRTFTRADLGLTFMYPAKFGDVDFIMTPSEEGGKMFRGTFTKVEMEFGGTSADFVAGREMSFLDFGIKYGQSGRTIANWVEINEYAKTIPVKGATVYVLMGKDSSDPFDRLMTGDIAALVKLNSKEFPGVAFSSNMRSVSVAEFEAMMSTVEVR